MCRVSYFPQEFVQNCSEEYIIQFLKYLENSNGGHGNGFYYIQSGRLEKSVKTPLEELYDNPYEEGFLFHTRRRSHGPINDFLCHPFETGRYVLIHNGIWHDYSSFQDLYGIPQNVSDSYVMAQVINHYGLRRFFNAYSHIGVVILYDKINQKVYCAYTSGDFEVKHTKFGYIYASSFGRTRSNKKQSDLELLNQFVDKKNNAINYGIYELSPDHYSRINIKKKVEELLQYQKPINDNVVKYSHRFSSLDKSLMPIDKMLEMINRYESLMKQTYEDLFYHLSNFIDSQIKRIKMLEDNYKELSLKHSDLKNRLKNRSENYNDDGYRAMDNYWETLTSDQAKINCLNKPNNPKEKFDAPMHTKKSTKNRGED